MKPTRMTARSRVSHPGAGALCSRRDSGVPFMQVDCGLQNCALWPDFLAFLEVDFTTEGSQPYRGSSLVDGTCEGTPLFHQEGGVRLGLQGNVVLNLAAHRLRFHIDRGILWDSGVDVPGVAVEPVFTGVAKITVIHDLSTG